MWNLTARYLGRLRRCYNGTMRRKLLVLIQLIALPCAALPPEGLQRRATGITTDARLHPTQANGNIAAHPTGIAAPGSLTLHLTSIPGSIDFITIPETVDESLPQAIHELTENSSVATPHNGALIGEEYGLSQLGDSSNRGGQNGNRESSIRFLHSTAREETVALSQNLSLDAVREAADFTQGGGLAAGIQVPAGSQADERPYTSQLRQSNIVVPAGEDASHEGWMRALVLLGENTVAYAGMDGVIRIFNFRTKQLEGVLKGHTGTVRALTRTPDRKYLFSADDTGAAPIRWKIGEKVGDTATPQIFLQQPRDKAPIRVLITDGKSVIGAGGGRLFVWDVQYGDLRKEIALGQTAYDLVVYGSHVFAACNDGVVRKIDLESGHVSDLPGHHAGRVRSLALSPDKTLLLSSGESKRDEEGQIIKGQIISRDVKTGHVLNVYSVDNGWIRAMNFNSKNNRYRLVTGNIDGRIQEMGVEADGTINPGEVLYAHGDVVFGVVVNERGYVASTGRDMRLIFKNGRLLELRGQGGPTHALDFIGKNELLGANQAGELVHWRLPQTSPVGRSYEHTETARALATEGGYVATGGDDNTIIVRTPDNRRLELTDDMPWIRTLAFDSTRLLASGSNDPILRLWDRITGQLLRRIHLPESIQRIYASDFNPVRSDVAIGGWDGVLRVVRNVMGDSPVLQEGPARHTDYIRTLRHSPDLEGTEIATGGRDHSIWIWDASTLAPLYQLVDPALRQRVDGAYVPKNTAHDDDVYSIDYHPSGRYLASASDDRTVKVWDLAKQTLVRVHEGLRAFYAVRFHPSGLFYTAVDDLGKLTAWDMGGNELTPEAIARLLVDAASFAN